MSRGPADDRSAGSASSGEPLDILPLPGSFDGMSRVVLPYPGHRDIGGHPVEHRDTRQRRAGPAASTAATDLDAFSCGPGPGLEQGVSGLVGIRREPEIGPAHPSGFPGNRRRSATEEVEGELRIRSDRRTGPQPTASQKTPRGQLQRARHRRRPPHIRHVRHVPPVAGNRRESACPQVGRCRDRSTDRGHRVRHRPGRGRPGR